MNTFSPEPEHLETLIRYMNGTATLPLDDVPNILGTVKMHRNECNGNKHCSHTYLVGQSSLAYVILPSRYSMDLDINDVVCVAPDNSTFTNGYVETVNSWIPFSIVSLQLFVSGFHYFVEFDTETTLSLKKKLNWNKKVNVV